jgi:transporter family protein
MPSSQPFSTAPIKFSHDLLPNASATAWAGFVVEASAATFILLYLAFLWLAGRWNQKFSVPGFNYSLLTGICVGAGTIAFFLLFQKGGPLSAVPAILAGGAAIMAIAGILFFHETASWQRVVGVLFAIIGLFLLRK